MAARGMLCPFPLLVQGDWGSPDPPKSLKNKLLCYFQSRKKSGGGECEIQLRSGQVLVCFAEEEVRQQVLSQKIHELDLAGKGKLKLLVTLQETKGATKENVSEEKLPEQGPEREDQQEERGMLSNLQKEDDTVANSARSENPCHEEEVLAVSQVSSLVVLENVEESVELCMLTLLVENISGLTGENDFQIELITEKKAAVITFLRSIDAAKFIDGCARNVRLKEFKITARPLELTHMVKIENLPAGVRKEFITLYFESPKHGGGQVSNIRMLPEEDSAVITFSDHQAVQNVLEKQHSFNDQPVLVYPYYSSLDIVLYGKERPQIKMPEPIKVPLDPYIWQFLQSQNKLIQEIDKEMANSHCELTWPKTTSRQPEVMMHPLPALSKQRGSMMKLVNTWKDKVSTEFTCIMSKFKTAKCEIFPEAWETIKSSFIKDDVLAIPDISKEIVVLAGFVFTVDSMAKLIKIQVENLTKDAEKAKQTIQETLSVAPIKYAVLHKVLLENNIYKENPNLKLSYDSSAKTIQLSGAPAEVYKIKSDLLEKLHSMAEKNVNFHPHVLQFLQHTSSKKVSAVIFDANKINAFYELANGSVELVGHSAESLLKAEEQMKKDLDNKCINLEDQEIINKREWKELIRQLEKKHNSKEDTVIIDDCLVQAEDAKVTIAGYTKAVADVYSELSDFVERNTRMLKVIPVKSIAILQFLEKEKGKAWHNLKTKGLKMEFGPPSKCKNIILSGPKAEVLNAANVCEEMLSSLHSINVMFEKPGVTVFFTNREHSYVTEVKERFKCLIRLQKHGEYNEGSPSKIGNPYAEIKLKDGIAVEVHMGDLTCYPVDVVVNASNEELKHIGGLADALSKAAGPQLQQECDDLVWRHGSLKPGRAVITRAWNLPCKEVIHAVGPRWNSSAKEKCTLQLKKAVRESLHLAETNNHRSIAIPAISSGIFGFPLKECAHSIVTAIKEAFEESAESGCLKQICLVDLSENTVQALSDALNEVFVDGPPQAIAPSPPQLVSQPQSIGGDYQMVTSTEGLKLILQQKGIEDAMTDVVVSSIGTDLKLGVGLLSKALLQKAGPMLQAEFDQALQGQGVQAGSVIQTGGCNLDCRFVLHVVLPMWDGGKGNAMQNLRKVVRECLEKTEELSLCSVSFPAIGAGGFSFPRFEVAKLMFEEALQFSSRKTLKSLQEVHFFLPPNNKENLQAFLEIFESKINGTPSVVRPSDEQTGFFGLVSTPILGFHEMQIGSIKFQVATGDITKENTDVIVNVTNENFSAKSGVSKAILKGGGPQVEIECAALASQPHSGFIITKGGSLICKKIIHLAPNPDTKAQVNQVLRECEAKMYTSVAFPAIGTGQAGRTPEKAADDIISAITEFASKESPQRLKMVKIVIFQPHMQNAFYASMKNREGRALHPPKSVISKIKEIFIGEKQLPKKKRQVVLEKREERAIFEICGESKKNVEAAETWLKQLILQEQTEKNICHELIDMFDDEEIKKLNGLQKRLHISIQLEMNESPPFILVSGIPRDVLDAFEEIQKLIDNIKNDREEKSKAELAQNLVEWQYSINGNTFTPFDMITNLHLEDAKISNKMHIGIQLQGNSYTTDIKQMTAKDGQGRSISIKRITKDQGKLSVALPEQWDAMMGNRVKVIVLNSLRPEYKMVEARFRNRCPTFKIEKIERIQNPFLWQSYQVKKQEINKKNGHDNNEKILFHGTPGSTVTLINQTGFNRSYAGKNAAALGNGTYFAVHADYSAHDTYSLPDGSGKKYMYVARVLTGKYCIGKQGLITPPPKQTGGVDLYDSVTDNIANPSVFVIFYDAQAYPEYLITFRR
ncbi:protein mono-ADP-ribosyltransferase PARP14 [Hemicordylus capensis]|uniref:protein mono-ADP-ribosyltransferase PARP14 n=1 Tax=Hemicordylus capensis TaxID=884348 RepID=UPI0023045D71|nr:protein mono-ADP-ribosyltransferase PARP14 [Hemicordylus capensis]